MEIGTDIVSIERIKKSIENDKFIKRIATDKEIKNSPLLKSNYYGKIFALKEALSKALGTGIGGGVSFKDFEIDLKAGEKITVNLKGKAQELIGTREVLLSVTMLRSRSKSSSKVIGLALIN